MSHKELTYEELEARLAEAEAVIEALRSEQVDAIVGEKHLALVRLKEVEEALAESGERYRRLMEISYDGIAIHREGEIVFANPALAALLGAEDPGQLLGRDVKEFVSSEYREVLEDRLRQVREQGEAPLFEERLLRLDGTAVDVEVAGVRTTYEGQPAVQVVIRDITARQWAQDALSRYAQESAERVKQLNCLYGISALVEKPDITLEEILRGVVRLIPFAWRYPEIACARLTIESQEYRTDNYRKTAWEQTADIVIRGEQAGTLQVCYLEERSESDEGPFAQEEWLLIRAIAERLGRIIARLRVEEALRESQRALTIRNQIARVFLTTTDEEMYGEVLQVVLEASESKYGVFGYIDGEGNLVCPSMTRDIWDECQIPDKDTVFPPEKWGGIWGRALTEAKSFYSNGPLHVPQGHVPVVRVVAVPIIHRGEVIGLLEVGNKETDYGEQDQELLDATAGYIAPVLQAMLDRDREERERRRAQQALRESEQRYRDLVENVDDVLYAIDASGELTYASPAMETMLGYAPSEVVGRSFTEFISPQDLPVVTQNFRRLLAGDSVGISEYRMVSKSGEMRWMRVSSRPVFANHHIVGVRGVLSDVTEWKQTERALQESERRYRQLVQALQEGIWAIDQDGHTTFVNPRMAEMLGYTEDEMIGADLFSFMEEESVKIAKRLLQRRAIGIKEQHDFEFLCKDGTTFYASLETTPITSAEGHYIGAIAAVADITKRRKAEEELRAAKDAAERARHEEEERRQEAERRRQIAESLADVMTVLNSNRSLEEVLDYIAMQTAELLGNQAVGIYRLEEDGKLAIRAARGLLVAYATGREIPVGQAALRRAMASREPVPIPDLAHRLDRGGTAIRQAERTTLAQTWADIYQALLAVPIIVGDELYGGVALYYSEPREFPEEEIELATVFGDQVALAIENARLRDQVGEAAAVAERERLARDLHDAVTQTLFSATLIAEALPRVWERSPDRARDGLQELRSLTKGALAEMRTLLLELRPAALTEKPLGDLLGQLAEAMAGRSRVPIKLTVEGDSLLPEELQVAMYRIAQEALNNVAKHADASEASVSLLCEPGRVTLRIRDDGCGFDPADTLPEQLGIAIMQERADSIGARMEVTSQLARGTEVAVDWQEAGRRQAHD